MIPPHLLLLVVWIPIAIVWMCVRWRSAESDAEHQRDDNEWLRGINTGLRDDNEWLRGINTGLRDDLMATRQRLDGAVEAKALLRRQSRARLREARRWRDRAKAAGWTRGSAP